MNTGLVTIVEQGDVRRKPPQCLNLMNRECSTRVGHHITYTTLVHGYHVGISLHHKHMILLGYISLCLIKAIEFAFLMEDIRLRRIDIFLLHALGARVEQATTECIHLTRHREPREYHPAGISVNKFTIVLSVAQSSFHQIILLISGSHSRLRQRVAPRQGISQLKFLDDIIAYATAAEILQSYGLSVGVLLKYVNKVVLRPLVDDKHTLAVGCLLLLLGRQFALTNLYIVFLGEPSQCIGIGYLLVLHKEVYGIASLTASKAVANTLCGRHHKRGGLVVMKRTKPLVVDACLAQSHKFRDDINDVGRLQNLVYGISIYHNRCKVSKKI